MTTLSMACGLWSTLSPTLTSMGSAAVPFPVITTTLRADGSPLTWLGTIRPLARTSSFFGSSLTNNFVAPILSDIFLVFYATKIGKYLDLLKMFFTFGS
jgi:hypothetical protein